MCPQSQYDLFPQTCKVEKYCDRSRLQEASVKDSVCACGPPGEYILPVGVHGQRVGVYGLFRIFPEPYNPPHCCLLSTRDASTFYEG